MKKLFLLINFGIFILFCVGCGVKSDPLPPEKTVEPGRGKPTFRRAIQDSQLEIEDEDEEAEDQDEETR